MSLAVGGTNVTTAPLTGPVAVVVIGPGTFWNAGGGTVTVTVNVTDCISTESLAVQVTGPMPAARLSEGLVQVRV